MNKKSLSILCLFFLLIFSSFVRGKVVHDKKRENITLTAVQIVDRNGMSETISNKDRLKTFRKIDFLKSQNYQKVVRVFARNQKGEIFSILTSYHENGGIKQYLEAINGRAQGHYKEWHPNGSLSLETNVVNGTADLTMAAEKSWLFDGMSTAWDEEGNLLAEISYEKGSLEGLSKYYHKNGKTWKETPFHNNLIDGCFSIYLENGQIFQTTEYTNGVKNGTLFRFWPNAQLAAKEEYDQGRLLNGLYQTISSDILAEISDGYGQKAVFGKDFLLELQEYRNGMQEGNVTTFSHDGSVVNQYIMKNGQKNGEEMAFYPGPNPRTLKPRLSISWCDGKVHGLVKSWYENGSLESQKEISNNQKNGLLTAWYEDGSLMMIEEYAQDVLVKGEYYKKGEKHPVSEILQGYGSAYLFDSKGTFLEKIEYAQGKPVQE